jgi:tetratricopeptide (TPR) repeat protein
LRVRILLILLGCTSAPEGLQRPAGVALCYSPTGDQQTSAFFDVFLKADYAARPAALQALEGAAMALPSEEEVALVNGLGHLWRIAEPAPQDPDSFLAAALTAKAEVQRAFDLCPSDYRIPAWLGPILVNMGRQLNDQATIDQGLAVLQVGIDHYPAFVQFSKLLIYADSDGADFQKALAAVESYPCPHTDPACVNTPHAVHNAEGAALFLGDVYDKAGRRDDALAIYRAAQQSKDYASWPFRPLLEARMAGSPAEYIWRSTSQCSVCHQR